MTTDDLIVNRISAGANSFALRLLALIVVPLLGLGVLAIQRIDDEVDDAQYARTLVDNARLEQAVAAVYVPAQLEQIALEGLASVDELGVPRDLVVAIVGVDFSVYTSNVALFDAAVDTLSSEHGDSVLSDGTLLRDRLSRVEASLAEQRDLSNEGLARQGGIRQVFTELAEVLDDALSSAGLKQSGRDAAAGQQKLSGVSLILRAAGDRGRSLLQGLVDQSPGTSEQTVGAAARLELSVEQLELVLDADEIETLDDLMSRLEPLPPAVATARPDSIAEDFDAAYIQESGRAVLNQLDFLELLQDYSADVHDEVVAELEVRANDAEQAADRTKLLVLATVVVSLTLLLVIAWATLSPLRRLTRRADLIGNGDFDSDPLPVAGPSDVRTLISTVNTMADTLAGVDSEITRLAAGGSGGASVELPGAIGESIDQSFRRLETMTSRLHASELLASAIVEKAADAIWTVDSDGKILSANDASVELVGAPAAEQIDTALSEYLHHFDGETTITDRSGEEKYVVVSSSVIEGGRDGNVTAVMAHDVSDRRRFQERLSHQAHHDPLTGLPNRLSVLEALDKSEPNEALAVLFVDLDGFKSVNDMQGHLVGDRVLTEVGDRLLRQVRTDDVVGRLGGDEFMIVMSDVESSDQAVEFASRIVAELEQPYRDGAATFSLSASVGVVTFLDGLGPERLTPLDAIKRADGAVYAAKARGRGHVEVYDSDLEARLTRSAEIEHSLRNAIDDDELELHLQPVLDLATNTFTSAEALVRWNRPGVGMIPPGDFIPIAEKSALIEDIGRWVLNRACETIAVWQHHDPGSTTRIAVNIAGSHLLDGDLAADVDAALRTTGANPARLELELTESQLMDDYGRVNEVLQALRERGIRIAIDDFGTGYSSMAYLRELPIDTLKIDRSFISPIVDADSDTTVIDALLTVGHALGLSIVAEGIETEIQLQHLTERGCDRAQGFLMARPMPIDQASPLVGNAFVRTLAPS